MAELPLWQSLDQAITPDLEGTEHGRIVAIVASEGAVEGGWAERAAVQLAKDWSQSGHKVMLVDGALQHPSLHTTVGLENGEGLSDAILFGASVRRVAHPVADGGPFLITAGTPVADTNAVIRNPRWARLTQGFVEAEVTLAIYVRDGEGGAAATLGTASEIVVLATEGEPAPGAVRDLEPLVRLVAGVGSRAAVQPKGAPDVAPRGAPGSLSAAALKQTAQEGRTKMVLLLVVALLLVAVVLAVFGVIPMPWLSPDAADGTALSLTTGSVAVAA